MVGDEAVYAEIEERVQKGVIERLEKFLASSFARVDYTEAVALLQKSGKKFEYAPQWGIDMQTEHERFLCEEHVGRPVVVMNYPEAIKAFYMRSNDDGKTVRAMDVLVPGVGESITEVELGDWLKNEGDFVRRDEEVVEVETDKVVLELPASAVV